jgi:hypothetical protein
MAARETSELFVRLRQGFGATSRWAKVEVEIRVR